MTVKIRKVGTSNVLTVPKSIKNPQKEYEVYEGRDGAIVYLPKKKNPFEDPEYVKSHLYDGDDTGFVEGEVDDNELL
ncbi:AbrB/MazE/SpoVT family DNA-binding domain-containing protein [Limosilactobacillus sp.]|uniref:AbrB/MazE/SpoVT family DNA-binding domain-containing protein n=1 Tax=Limosilactobacillus sp. TaxID=2773925 RepID=UPI003F03D6BB